MRELIVALRDLCLLRIGPQDLPYAPTLLGTLVGLNLVLAALVGGLLDQPGTALLATAIGIVVSLGALYLLLAMRHIHARFVQAGTALLGTALLFGILSIPAQFVLTPMPTSPESLTHLQMWALLLAAPLGIWSWVVRAHIFRHALNWSFIGGLLLALFINFAVMAVLQSLLPAPA